MSRVNIILIIVLLLLLFLAKTDSASERLLSEHSLVSKPAPTSSPTPSPTPTISPPVFFSIPKISVNAPVVPVGVDEQGNQRIFIVSKKEIYEFDKVSMEEVFGKTDKKRLNLITCTGIFSPLSRNYSQRMIIYAELVE